MEKFIPHSKILFLEREKEFHQKWGDFFKEAAIKETEVQKRLVEEFQKKVEGLETTILKEFEREYEKTIKEFNQLVESQLYQSLMQAIEYHSKELALKGKQGKWDEMFSSLPLETQERIAEDMQSLIMRIEQFLLKIEAIRGKIERAFLLKAEKDEDGITYKWSSQTPIKLLVFWNNLKEMEYLLRDSLDILKTVYSFWRQPI